MAHHLQCAHCWQVLFAFSPLIWLYAIGSEVFALNNALAALLLLLTVRFSKTGSMTAARLGAMVCGLGLANQHTIVLFIIPCVAWVAFLLHRVRRRRLCASFASDARALCAGTSTHCTCAAGAGDMRRSGPEPVPLPPPFVALEWAAWDLGRLGLCGGHHSSPAARRCVIACLHGCM